MERDHLDEAVERAKAWLAGCDSSKRQPSAAEELHRYVEELSERYPPPRPRLRLMPGGREEE